MDAIFELKVNQNILNAYNDKRFSLFNVIFMLLFRLFMFAFSQVLFYILFNVLKYTNPWEQAANWWPFSVIITNILCVFILDKLLIKENRRFKDFFIFEKGTILKNSLLFVGILIISMPISFLPNILLGTALFGDFAIAGELFFRPLPVVYAWISAIVFPLTMPLGELTVYFGYVMPRLEIITKKKWLSILLPSLLLSFQHFTLPLLFDWRFIVWRLFMFLPFAFMIALIIRWKPKLLPYFLIGHFFIDLTTSISVLMVSI